MAISSTYEALSDDWVLISSTTPAGLATSVSFTSIPVHRKLMIVDKGVLASATAERRIRLNNDTNAVKYSFTRFSGSTPTLASVTNDYFVLHNSTLAASGSLIIDSANTSNPKIITAFGSNNIMPIGVYLATAAIDRIDYILSTSSVSSSNSIAIELYGVK